MSFLSGKCLKIGNSNWRKCAYICRWHAHFLKLHHPFSWFSFFGNSNQLWGWDETEREFVCVVCVFVLTFCTLNGFLSFSFSPLLLQSFIHICLMLETHVLYNPDEMFISSLNSNLNLVCTTTKSLEKLTMWKEKKNVEIKFGYYVL